MGYFVSAGIAMAVVLRTAHGVFHAASSNASAMGHRYHTGATYGRGAGNLRIVNGGIHGGGSGIRAGSDECLGLQAALWPRIGGGAAGATFFVVFDFGIALGGFVAGVLVKAVGFDAIFLLMIVPCLLS